MSSAITYTCIIIAARGKQCEEFTLHADQMTAIGIAVTSDRVYMVDPGDRTVYAYDLNGEIRAGRGFSTPTGISVTSDRVYVVNNTDDNTDDKIYVYNHSAARQTSEEFALHSDNANAIGLAVTSSRVYVLDLTDIKVYVYNHSGTRQASEEFDLHIGHTLPTGIAIAFGSMYIPNRVDRKVYVYNYSGTRQESKEFHFSSYTASGIAVTATRVYVIDENDTIYVYNYSGRRLLNEEAKLRFIFHDDTSILSGASSYQDRLYVVLNAQDDILQSQIQSICLCDPIQLFSSNGNSWTEADSVLI